MGDVVKLKIIQHVKVDLNGIVTIIDKEIVFDYLKITEQFLNDCCDLLYQSNK